jgi:outer membrane receptor protein involved in Fe transport
LGLLGGLRLNHTDERRDNGDDSGDRQAQRASTTRLSGSFGVNWRIWKDAERDLDVIAYASYGNTFQPSQIDFGPDNPRPLLQISTGSYITMDCTLGYAFRRFQISLNGSNLTNRRNPVLQSELGEGQFYLFPARRLFVKLSASL